MWPSDWADETQDRINQHWDLAGPLPLPRRTTCWCGGVLVVKDWKFHLQAKTGTSRPWRCDVRLKCVHCSFVPMYGIAVTENYYDARPRDGWISWREGKRILEA